MSRRQTVRQVLYSSVVLSLLGGALPSLGGADPAVSTFPPKRIDCADRRQRPEDASPGDDPCGEPSALRTEEELSTLRHEEEKGEFRWRAREPSERDLSLWYYPGAPRPLWGY